MAIVNPHSSTRVRSAVRAFRVGHCGPLRLLDRGVAASLFVEPGCLPRVQLKKCISSLVRLVINHHLRNGSAFHGHFCVQHRPFFGVGVLDLIVEHERDFRVFVPRYLHLQFLTPFDLSRVLQLATGSRYDFELVY